MRIGNLLRFRENPENKKGADQPDQNEKLKTERLQQLAGMIQDWSKNRLFGVNHNPSSITDPRRQFERKAEQEIASFMGKTNFGRTELEQAWNLAKVKDSDITFRMFDQWQFDARKEHDPEGFEKYKEANFQTKYHNPEN